MSRVGSRFTFRPLRALAAAGLVALLAVPGSPARGQEGEETEDPAAALGGFQLVGAAVGMEATFHQPGALPAEPTAQGSVPYSTTNLSTGPTATALASVAWPGVLFANGGTAAEQSGAPPGFGDTFNYKVRSEAFSPQGPEQHENNGYPGVTMKTQARPDESVSDGQASGSDSGFTGSGSFTSHSRSALEDGKGVVDALATASDLVLAAGVVTIDSVITTARATTDGVAVTLEGQTTVNGLMVAGQPATVDGDGVHASDQGGGLGPLTASSSLIVNQALAQAHVKMHVVEPEDHVDGPNGERVLGGLVVEWVNTATDPDQTWIYTFGGALVSVAASPGFTFEEEPDVGLGDEPVDEPDEPDDVVLPDDSGPPDDGTSGGRPDTGTSSGGETALGDLVPISYPGGLPAWLLLLALAVAAGLAAGLRRLSDDVLAQRATAACPEERS